MTRRPRVIHRQGGRKGQNLPLQQFLLVRQGQRQLQLGRPYVQYLRSCGASAEDFIDLEWGGRERVRVGVL
jgi:hypothetical protein